MRLGHVGERAIGVRVILLEMIERGVERGLVAVADDLCEQGVELGFPEAIFDAAAGRKQRERQTDEFVGIGREAFSGSLAHRLTWLDARNLSF
ncbi:hypothetical protein DM77_3230 [Burkholderia mallei]|nr:hypothetical protein DM77_3230 [Burkholderia mallei]